MQKLVKFDNMYSSPTIPEINDFLLNGWKVIQMCPLAQPVAITGSSYSTERGNYGALLLLEKED